MFYYSQLGKNTLSNVVHCPFNTSHTMPQKTLILHLTKCPDRKPNLSVCPFNNLHVFESSLLGVSKLIKKKVKLVFFKVIILLTIMSINF